jgi:hypothetical protein
MKQLFLVLLIFVATTLNAQVAGEEYTVEEFGWTMTIPEGFEVVAPKDWEKHRYNGLEIIEDYINEDLDEALNITEVIYVINSGDHNVLEVNKQPYDTAIDGDPVENDKFLAEVLSEAFKQKIPDAIIETKFSSEELNGKLFRKTTMVLKKDKFQFVSYMYSKIFDDTELTINIMYINPLKGMQMVKALKASTFK